MKIATEHGPRDPLLSGTGIQWQLIRWTWNISRNFNIYHFKSRSYIEQAGARLSRYRPYLTSVPIHNLLFAQNVSVLSL